MTRKKSFVVVTLLMLLFLFLTFGPIFTIWSLNALFGLEIPVNIKTWAAVLWILTMIHGIRIALKSETE